jgi:hypothetical protein
VKEGNEKCEPRNRVCLAKEVTDRCLNLPVKKSERDESVYEVYCQRIKRNSADITACHQALGAHHLEKTFVHVMIQG